MITQVTHTPANMLTERERKREREREKECFRAKIHRQQKNKLTVKTNVLFLTASLEMHQFSSVSNAHTEVYVRHPVQYTV